MNESRRSAVVAALAWRLRAKGSWSGETHIQKATYLLQHLAGVSLDYEFILYKHGPFSFELRDTINAMRADGVFELTPRPYPYGPSLLVDDKQRGRMEALYPNALEKYGGRLDLVANWVVDSMYRVLNKSVRHSTSRLRIRRRVERESAEDPGSEAPRDDERS